MIKDLHLKRSFTRSLATVAFAIFMGMPGWGQIAQFNFPASNSLVVSVKDANVSVSNMTLSAGTIETNITTGTYFPNEPYIEETGGWTATTQATAKNFNFTITANSGYQFSITNISFRAYATSAGPSAFSFGIGSTDIYSVNAPDGSLVAINQSVTGQTNLTTATIKIQGWLNGSRASSGSGVFRLDDVIITGTVTTTGTPDISLSDNGTQILTADVNQGTNAVVLHKSQLAVTTSAATLTGMTCTTAGNYISSDITNLKVRYSTDATLDAGDATLSTYTNPGVAGAKTFPSFTAQSISSGATGYIFITADIAASATHNNTISVDALATGNYTFSSGNKTGSTTAGGLQTIKDVTSPTVSAYSPTDENTSVAVDQNLILTFNENVKVGTSGSIVIYNSGGTVFETIPYNDSRITFLTNTVTINPASSFAFSSGYYVQTTGSPITDMYDNAYAGISIATTWNFTTVCGPVTSFPYAIDFSTYLPTCWSETAGILASPSTLSGTTSTWTEDGYANSGSTGSARINIYGTTAKEWLISPTIDLGTTTDYQLEFDLALTAYASTGNPATTGTDDKFAVVISTDNGIIWSSANILKLWDNVGSSNVYNNLTPAGTHVTIVLASFTGQVKIGFYGESTISNADNDLFIDNVLITEVPSCVMPTSVASSSVSSTTATISWTASVSSPSDGYQYEVRTNGAAGSGASGLAVSGTTEAGNVNADISALTDNTTYNVYVRADCGAGDFSSWTTAYSFTTINIAAPAATSASSVLSTGFTANWNAVESTTTYRLDVSTTNQFSTLNNQLSENFSGCIAGTHATPDGTNIASSLDLYLQTSGWTGTACYQAGGEMKLGASSTKGSLTTKTIDLSGNGGNATLSFDLSKFGSDATIIQVFHASDGSTFSQVGSDITAPVTMTTQSMTITNGTANSKIKIEAKNASSYRFYLDNLSITQSINTNLTGYDDLPVSGTSKVITGLIPFTTYYYRVRAVGTNSTSANSNVISVTTSAATATTWTGSTSNAWDVSSNWSDGVPASTTDVTIPAGLSNYPTLTAAGTCKNISLGSNATSTATLLDNGYLTVTGTASVQRYFSGNTTDWHLVSSPITAATANVFFDMYLQQFDPTPDFSVTAPTELVWYTDITSPSTQLTKMEGYGLYSTLDDANTVTFTGTLNTGAQSHSLSRNANNTLYGWNLLGNPFPSSIDWDAVTIPDGMNTEVHFIDSETGGDLSYVKGVGGAARYIPPMQGFFVSAAGEEATSFGLSNTQRTHSGANNFYKSENPNMLVLQAEGQNFSDNTYIHFNDQAGFEHDGVYDAYKIITASNPELPQLFSYTPANVKLSINGMPETATVPVGFTSMQSGTFTLSASKTGDLIKVVLEDLLTGVQTDLLTKNYTFNYTPGDDEKRFKVHFSTTGIDEKETVSANIYSYQQTVYVNLADNTQGDIYIYNLAGQLVTARESASGNVQIGLNTTGVYMVKVITEKETLTQKVVIR